MQLEVKHPSLRNSANHLGTVLSRVNRQMPTGRMPKRHNGPKIHSIDSRKHIVHSGRPSPAPLNPPILNVPNGIPAPNKINSKGPPKLKPIPLVPKPAVNDHNGPTRLQLRKGQLTELRRMIAVRNTLHKRNLRDRKRSRRRAQGAKAKPSPKGGPGAKPAGRGLGAAPPKNTLFGRAASGDGEAEPEQPGRNEKGRVAGEPGGRPAATRRRRTEGGGVRRVFGLKSRIVYSVSD
ncbi:hypothetical protein Lesp02_61760 [Lentzea sp. NBRC 105346]|nr:hypothetical protein Lesp02_61760 [Lentzea sp. NBRC 105346]